MTQLAMLEIAADERVHHIDGERMRTMRCECYEDPISQTDLARYVGVRQPRISNLEWNRANRTNSLSLPIARMIAEFFGCDVWELQTDGVLILRFMKAAGVRDLPEDVARRFAQALVLKERALAAARRVSGWGICAPSWHREESVRLAQQAELSLIAAVDLDEMYRAAERADRCHGEG